MGGKGMAELQRGRARAGAEFGSGNSTVMPMTPASTGPRPRGRGISMQLLGRPVLVNASTGPRPRGRGIRLVPPHRGRGRSSFNGAAPARARNFDGFARRHAWAQKLQRGRARAGAEFDARRGGDALAALLQRGRARAGAEFGVRPPH